MAFRIWIDGGPGAQFPILRLDPLDPPEQRSGHRGPLDAEIFQQLTLLVRARCQAAGYPYAQGGRRNSWHWSAYVPARDAPLLIDALRAYLEDLDEQPLRQFLRSPPDLRRRPAVGESWAYV